MRHGFILMETILYLTGCFVLACFFGLCMLNLHEIIQQQLVMSRQWITTYTAHDKIIADIQTAFLYPNAFLVVNAHELLWSDGKKQRGWSLIKNKLVLHRGLYNLAQSRWEHARKTTVAEGITDLLFLPTRHDGIIIGIECRLTKEKISILRYSAL